MVLGVVLGVVLGLVLGVGTGGDATAPTLCRARGIARTGHAYTCPS